MCKAQTHARACVSHQITVIFTLARLEDVSTLRVVRARCVRSRARSLASASLRSLSRLRCATVVCRTARERLLCYDDGPTYWGEEIFVGFREEKDRRGRWCVPPIDALQFRCIANALAICCNVMGGDARCALLNACAKKMLSKLWCYGSGMREWL